MIRCRFRALAACLGVHTALIGCAGAPQRSTTPVPMESSRPAEPASSEPVGRPAALIAGSSVSWADMRPALVEAAGRIVLEEIALDRAVRREASRRGIVVTDAMVRAEEDALLDELAVAGPMGSRVEVLERIRLARGLGPSRFDGLLRRNAALRAIVGDESRPGADEIALAERIAFGPAYRVRLFVSASDRDAASARDRVMSTEHPVVRTMAMSAVCTEGSAHPSSADGGLIERFSPFDPAYPDVVRDAASRLNPGEVSPIMATPGGFAFMLLEKSLPEQSASDAERSQVERRLRIRKERLAMERLAVELLARTEVSPVDPDLARAWRERR